MGGTPPADVNVGWCMAASFTTYPPPNPARAGPSRPRSPKGATTKRSFARWRPGSAGFQPTWTIAGLRRCGLEARAQSPQVRGNRSLSLWRTSLARSIPAGAGEPVQGADLRGAMRVYPRRCGGTRRSMTRTRSRTGLSPQVRGNRGPAHTPCWHAGSIPAGAGNPTRRRRPGGCSGSIPAGAGEPGTTGRWSRRPARGLPPQVRGNLLVLPGAARNLGSIPAGAGEPSTGSSRRSRRRVYPRRCGGTHGRGCGGAIRRGLSPQVRGNRPKDMDAVAILGSIPAGAGEPSGPRPPPGTVRVYPRRCGGTSSGGSYTDLLGGLSPQVRGNRSPSGGRSWRIGSIPAGAGEPVTNEVTTYMVRVYPRRCGGTESKSKSGKIVPGLSPQVRGNQQRARIGAAGPGSIPAGAGEPPRSNDGPVSGGGLSPQVRGNQLDGRRDH